MLAPAPTLPTNAFIDRLLVLTGESTHSYELAMHRLLLDLAEQETCGRLSRFEYEAVTGTALDVLFFFNYDPALLGRETDHWYRAAIIHQMAVAVLQALATMRPDLTTTPFYRENASAFAMERSTSPAPMHCHQWAPLLANAG